MFRGHADCRKNYTRSETIKKCVNKQNKTTISPVRRELRSTYVFNFKANCLFCNEECLKKNMNKKKKLRNIVVLSFALVHFVSNNRLKTWRKCEVMNEEK